MSKLRGLSRIISTLIARMRLRRLGVHVGHRVTFFGQPIVSLADGARMSIADDAILTSRARDTALGVRGPVILRCLQSNALIEIGRQTGISGAAICAAVAVKIGDRCLIGADCMIFDTDFHNHDPARRFDTVDWDGISKAVVIGDDVFLGARSVVLKGVSIGSGSIIGAGSVVVSDVPDHVVFAGVPARHVGTVASRKPALGLIRNRGEA